MAENETLCVGMFNQTHSGSGHHLHRQTRDLRQLCPLGVRLDHGGGQGCKRSVLEEGPPAASDAVGLALGGILPPQTPPAYCGQAMPASQMGACPRWDAAERSGGLPEGPADDDLTSAHSVQ